MYPQPWIFLIFPVMKENHSQLGDAGLFVHMP